MPISIQKARELIKDSERYSDAEIEEVIHACHDLAELAFDCWLEERKEKKAGLKKSSNVL